MSGSMWTAKFFASLPSCGNFFVKKPQTLLDLRFILVFNFFLYAANKFRTVSKCCRIHFDIIVFYARRFCDCEKFLPVDHTLAELCGGGQALGLHEPPVRLVEPDQIRKRAADIDRNNNHATELPGLRRVTRCQDMTCRLCGIAASRRP